MIYKYIRVEPDLLTDEYAEEYDLFTHSGAYVASIGLDWNMVSYEVTMTCWGGVPKALKGQFANLPSLEVAVRRHVRDPEAVNQEV